VYHQDSVIVWVQPKRNLEEECKIKIKRKSTGTITKLDDNTYKLVDAPGQLDYIYTAETQNICDFTLHKLKNVDGAYLQVQNKNWSHIYNVETKYCLNPQIRTPSKCSNLTGGEFKIVDNKLNIIPKNNSDKKICIAMSPFFHHMDECSNLYSLKWDPDSLEITGNTRCLQMNDNSSVFMNICSGENHQKWIFGMPEMNITESVDTKESLLLQHHQYVEDQSVTNENIIENELKRIYCNNLQMARQATSLISESSGLLAARANNLPMCHRLKPMGEAFLVQKCSAINITIGAKQTACGYEPFYDNQTIGKDGFSLHPFSECFWEDGIVNFNGKTFMWKKELNDWAYVHPNIHQSTLRLTAKFTELNDNEANYQLNHHEFYQKQEYEKINSINDLITRIQVTDASPSVTMNQEAESKFGKFELWHRIRKGLIAVISILFFIILCMLTIIVFIKVRTLRSKQRFEHYAEQLQENRKLIRAESLERKRAETNNDESLV
jgi:hypothetical protein